MSVVHATTAIDAFAVLESPRPVDLLLAATEMPGQPSGFTIARMAQRKRATLPVVYVARDGGTAEAEIARALGPVLQRPRTDDLVHAVRTAIEGR